MITHRLHGNSASVRMVDSAWQRSRNLGVKSPALCLLSYESINGAHSGLWSVYGASAPRAAKWSTLKVSILLSSLIGRVP